MQRILTTNLHYITITFINSFTFYFFTTDFTTNDLFVLVWRKTKRQNSCFVTHVTITTILTGPKIITTLLTTLIITIRFITYYHY